MKSVSQKFTERSNLDFVYVCKLRLTCLYLTVDNKLTEDINFARAFSQDEAFEYSKINHDYKPCKYSPKSEDILQPFDTNPNPEFSLNESKDADDLRDLAVEKGIM